jgi:hypothetical protein
MRGGTVPDVGFGGEYRNQRLFAFELRCCGSGQYSILDFLSEVRVAIQFLQLTLNPRTADAAGLIGVAHPRDSRRRVIART